MTIKSVLLASALAAVAAVPAQAQSFFPECFAPWDENTAQLDAVEPREGPYRIALVNGFAGNDWRIQMIQAARAYVARPEVAEKIEEFVAVSVGNDVAAQISAIENYVAAGFDAVLFIAVNPESFDAVIRNANRDGTLLVSFDNIVFNDDHLIIDIDHGEYTRAKTQAVLDEMEASGTDAPLLWVRGLLGNATESMMHDGFLEAIEGSGVEYVEVVGNWDTGVVQRVTADAIAAHGEFGGAVVQYGTMGAAQAMLDTEHPPIPVGSDTVNGSIQILAENGFSGTSIGSSPSISAVAIAGAIAALEGEEVPQRVGLPAPFAPSSSWNDGEAYFSDLPAGFDTALGFAPCNIMFTPEELRSQEP